MISPLIFTCRNKNFLMCCFFERVLMTVALGQIFVVIWAQLGAVFLRTRIRDSLVRVSKMVHVSERAQKVLIIAWFGEKNWSEKYFKNLTPPPRFFLLLKKTKTKSAYNCLIWRENWSDFCCWKKLKVLRIGEKVDQNFCLKFLHPVSAHARLPLSPPSTSAEIFRRTCLHNNLQISPPTPKNDYAMFQNSKTTSSKYPPPLWKNSDGLRKIFPLPARSISALT